MKAWLSFALVTFFFLPSYSQKSPIKFGVIPLEDLKMTVYPQDTSASAVVLTDYGEVYLSINDVASSLVFERHIRIKILTKEGLNYANAQIPLYHAGSLEERVASLKASTYNLENGRIVESKMGKEGIFKEKFNRNINLHKFTLPNVKEGSVIEYSYKINSEALANFPDWTFQRDIPIRHSEFWAIIPEFLFFEKYMQGYVSAEYEPVPKNYPDYSATGHHWTIKNVPAFKEEPFMTSEEDYISRVKFALSHISFPGRAVVEIMGSWGKLNSQLIEDPDFGKAISGNSFLKKIVDEVTAGKTDPLQKIEAIHQYVKQSVEWTGEKDKYADSFKKVMESKKGTAADINLLLASMLEKADINVEPILLSTRDHGFIRRSYPMSEQFNYVICLVTLPDNKTVFLDATNKFLPVNVLPEYCLNGEGMVVSEARNRWINIETKTKAKTIINSEFTLGEAGELKGKLQFIRDGYDACAARKSYSSKGEDTYIKDFLSGKTWEVGKTQFENIEDPKVTLKETHELTLPEHTESSGDVIYINPFVTGGVDHNPFKSEERMYPVDFGSQKEKMHMFKLVLPEGYVFDEIPQSKVFMLPDNAARYTFNVIQSGNTLNILSNLQINRNMFLQNEYPMLREFYNQVLAKQAEQIVVKKKL
jgi:hypothetical protein